MGNLEKEYVVLDNTGKSEIWRSEDFWEMAFDKNHPKNTEDLGYLVSAYSFDKDWESWENHPNGDEVVFCISGKLNFILDLGSEKSETTLCPGKYVVVPKNTWHTAKVSVPSKALFITWGYGTQHKDL